MYTCTSPLFPMAAFYLPNSFSFCAAIVAATSLLHGTLPNVAEMQRTQASRQKKRKRHATVPSSQRRFDIITRGNSRASTEAVIRRSNVSTSSRAIKFPPALCPTEHRNSTCPVFFFLCLSAVQVDSFFPLILQFGCCSPGMLQVTVSAAGPAG